MNPAQRVSFNLGRSGLQEMQVGTVRHEGLGRCRCFVSDAPARWKCNLPAKFGVLICLFHCISIYIILLVVCGTALVTLSNKALHYL